MVLTLRWQHFECQPLHMWTFLNATALYSAIVEQDRQRERGVAMEEGELGWQMSFFFPPPEESQMTYIQLGSTGGSFNT